MKWRTSISKEHNGERVIRGRMLTNLIAEANFLEATFLVLRGKKPTKRQLELFNAILVSSIEHGVEAPSAFVPRTVVSTGNSMNAALAAGVLAIGDFHGGAIESCARLLQSKKSAREIVAEALVNHARIPGYGHKVYKKSDPRAQALLKKARRLKLARKFVAKAELIEMYLKDQSGKTLPMNIDGAIAALILELGFDARLGKGFFVLARLPGMIAHVEEEMMNEKPYRRLDASDVEFTKNL